MLKVLKSGFFTTIQDKGRVGFASVGIPISGSMDSYSSDLANNILNNSVNCAVIEITLGACKFEFTKTTTICISGGDFSPTINNVAISLNKRILIHPNDILSFSKINYGIRCYLAVKDGFLSEEKLNSRSFYPNITKDFLLRKGDSIPYKEVDNGIETSKASIKINRNHFMTKVIECYKGPEFDLLNNHQQKEIFNTTFTISKDNSRMGYKLNEVIENSLSQILTSAVLPGTVQLTPSGKLIVLIRDCQVTGGYPRVLQLTETAINQLAQKTTSATLKFSLSCI
ncbi:biotin-dependent carboxyltransferase family protein [Polaribacter sp. Asnod6-C07]|uniref:5-oxoprolinase subunit C family protein n=1 Tax=Polaribacter sp. Asnod6-C07 TaxID=3160582 RepID=UPI00386A90BA